MFTLETLVEKFGDEISPYAVRCSRCVCVWQASRGAARAAPHAAAPCPCHARARARACTAMCSPSQHDTTHRTAMQRNATHVQVTLAQNLTNAFWKYSGMAEGLDEEEGGDDGDMGAL